MDSIPSFSLGISQDDPNREDEADIAAEEQHNSDDAGETSHIKDKKEKNVPSTSRSPGRKHHASRTSRASSSNAFRAPLPKGMSYVIKSIPKHPLKFGSSYNSNIVDDIKFSIGAEAVAKFRETIFGHYLDIPPCKFQGQGIKCIMLNEVKHKDMDIVHVRHSKGNVLSFSIREFALISGLKCTGNVEDFRYHGSPPSRLLKTYFPDAVSQIHKRRLVQRFFMGNWDTIEDAVQMAILYFIHTFVFSQVAETPISADDFRMVEDGSYINYPWGKDAYNKLMYTFRQDCTKAKQLYRLSGMPYVLNVWIYECASTVPNDIAVRAANRIPRILNWRVTGLKPKFEYFMSTIFSEAVCSNLTPTDEELASLDLPNTPDDRPQPDKSASGSNVSSRRQSLKDENVQVHGFEDFTSAPPTQLLRKSKRSCVTSASPPPKKQRTHQSPKRTPSDSAKHKKAVEFAQPHVSDEHKRSTPNKQQDVPTPSVSDDKRTEGEDITGLKEFLIKYIDDKFKSLESFMLSHHTATLKAIRDEVNSLKNDPQTSFHNESHQQDIGPSEFKGFGDSNAPETADQILQGVQPPVREEILHGAQQPVDDVNIQSSKNYKENIKVVVDNEGESKDDIVGDEQYHSDEVAVKDQVQESVNVVPPVHTKVQDESPGLDTSTLNQKEVGEESPLDEAVKDSPSVDIQDEQIHPEAFASYSSISGKEKEIESEAATNQTEDVSDFSEGTNEAIDALLHKLQNPISATPLKICTQEELDNNPWLLSDSQLPTTLPSKEIVLHDASVTPPQRSRNPSRFRQSPFMSSFSSDDKGKGKMPFTNQMRHPFEGYGICYQPPWDIIKEYDTWVNKGLLVSHHKRKDTDEHYKVRNSQLGVSKCDFVVATPTSKNWFYLMSQKNRCWTDEHIDVVLYYLRKKSKYQSSNSFRFTTVNCIFMNFVVATHARYYEITDEDKLSTQETVERISANAASERSVINMIKGFSIPAATPWHLVDEVFVPVNCGNAFHWVLAVIVLKDRLIRVYDSSSGSRRRNQYAEINKLAVMLPTYLHESGFFEKIDRTQWTGLDAYKDSSTGSFIGQERPFIVEFVTDIAKQNSDSLDCGVFVAAYAEYLSDGIPIPSTPLDADYIRKRYAALLWSYGTEKNVDGYESENDDPPRPRDVYKAPDKGKLIVLS